MKNLIQRKREILPKATKICAVIKANAYGFGLVKVASSLHNFVDYFAVARVYELYKLREAGIFTKTIILSPIVDESNIIQAIKMGGEIVVDNEKDLLNINEISKSINAIAKVHIKVDTGMNRFGVKDENIFKNILSLANCLLNVSVVGLFSHFATGDELCVKEQRRRFESFLNTSNKKGFFPLSHISSSVMSNIYPYDMVRLGIDLYQINESIEFSGRILEIKDVIAGEEIGYSHGYLANKDMKIAVIDIGYGDIAIRHLSNIGQVIINGKRCDIVGNVCMDCLFADITYVEASVGEKAILFGKQGECMISVCDVAEKCGTISYELFTSITERVKREYR